MASAYACAQIGYRRQIAPGVNIDAGFAFGRDFATVSSGIPTIGGEFVAVHAGASLRFGPGDLTVGTRFMNRPISESHHLHIRTAEYLIGYRVTF
uniref:Outer membrane protein beta-barrel domain-containing protein n=1 Tax=mine drainage metagenome TaxID=410659 RepID=E6PKL1_9ZZZZ